MKPIDWEADAKFLISELKSLKCVTLYLLSTGRNAWHSTWSAKYQRNAALFSSFDEAKAAAEKLRNRGTTFKIVQYPGLAFYSLEGIVALVEFHSSQPFNKLRVEDVDLRLNIGTPIKDAITPFIKADREFWNPPFPSGDSFVNVKTDLSEDFEPLIENKQLRKWGSVASGSNYYLGWHEEDKLYETPISRIMLNYAEVNVFVDLEKCEQELESCRHAAKTKRVSAQEAAIRFNEARANLMSIFEERDLLNSENDEK